MQINSNFPSPNFAIRVKKIEYIIIHYTEMSFEDALERLCDPAAQVSAHYLIKEDGAIYRLVEDSNIAWHAGKSYWNGIEKLNENSIGIELDNLGCGHFSPKQVNSLIELCQHLKIAYQIPTSNIIGHSDIAPDRKIDPGIFFDWQLMKHHGLGIFPEIENLEHVSRKILFEFGNRSPEILVWQHKLAKLGYKIELTGIFDEQTNFVVRAFLAHFRSKLIQRLGLNFYRNDNSRYHWDNISDKLLENLLLKIDKQSI